MNRCTPVWFVLCSLEQREILCEQMYTVWFVLCRLKRREILCEQMYTCMVCVVQVKVERDTV